MLQINLKINCSHHIGLKKNCTLYVEKIGLKDAICNMYNQSSLQLNCIKNWNVIHVTSLIPAYSFSN